MINQPFAVVPALLSVLFYSFYSQIRCIALRVCKLRMGFSVPSIIWVGAELCKSQCNALAQLGPQKQNWEWLYSAQEKRRKWRWWVNFLSRAGGRHCFILAKDKNEKDQKNLRRKLVDYCPNRAITSNKPWNTETETTWIETHQSQVNMCFLRGPLRWLTEQKNPKFLWSLQNAQRDTTNLAIDRCHCHATKI